MHFSYTQIAHYLTCPRKYRYRYVDGWREKETGARMLFGRAFETSLRAYFRREDATEALFRAWSAHKRSEVEYRRGESWGDMLEEGYSLLRLFAQEDRVHVAAADRDLQVEIARPLSCGDWFVGYIDALGTIDGMPSIIDWKTSGSRYPEDPNGLVALDPQLVCYSWLAAQPNVALVVFVRKRRPEIQYLRATISEEQRRQFDHLVRDCVARIQAGYFPQHSGIRFPQSPCTSCSFVGLCLDQALLVKSRLLRPQGGELDWLDQLPS